MKVLIKYILNNIRENKKRTILMMLSLFITGIIISLISSMTILGYNFLYYFNL